MVGQIQGCHFGSLARIVLGKHMLDTNHPRPTDSMIGKLLVASTTVQDPVLSRSVCLVVHQDTENVYAVLLNRPMTPPPGLAKLLHSASAPTGGTGQTASAGAGNPRFKIQGSNPGAFPTNLPGGNAEAQPSPGDASSDNHSLAEQTAAEASKLLGTIHFGGPLSGPVVAVHGSCEHAEAQAGKGVYVAAQRDVLETLVKQKPGPYRLIVGHLGWSIEQLQAEINAGYWHKIDATDDDVFTGDQVLWPSVIRRATTGSVATWLGIPDSPLAAEVN